MRAWLVAHTPNPYWKSSEEAFQTAINCAANRIDEVETERRTLAGMEGEYEPPRDAIRKKRTEAGKKRWTAWQAKRNIRKDRIPPHQHSNRPVGLTNQHRGQNRKQYADARQDRKVQAAADA